MIRLAACKVFGACSKFATEEDLWNILDAAILVPGPTPESRQGQMAALKGIAEHANDRPAVEDKRGDIVNHIAGYISVENKLDVQRMAAEAAASFVMTGSPEDPTAKKLLEVLASSMEENRI